MKFSFVFVLLASITSFGQQQRLRECESSCSPRCINYARDLVQAGQEILSACGNQGGSNNSDVIKRCSWHFGNTELGARCASRARSVDVINRCVWHFNNTEKAVYCSASQSIDVVNRCVWHFNNTDAGAQCAALGRSVSAVDACVREFGNNTSGLRCITGL